MPNSRQTDIDSKYPHFVVLPGHALVDIKWLDTTVGDYGADWYLAIYSSLQILYFAKSADIMIFKLKFGI